MKKAGLLLGMSLGLLVIFLTGCQDLESDHKGNLLIKLTDAPFPIEMIEEATVNISRVEIRIRSEGEELEYPFITLIDEPMEFNLLELRNGVTAELLNVELDEGNYNLIRLFVDEAKLVLKNGEAHTVKIPSGEQTGIKIFIKPAMRVAGGLTSEVLLDFDVEKSFLLMGNPDTPAGIKGFKFKPVLRAVNNATAGLVEGVVIDADSVEMENVSVWVEEADTVVSSAFTDAAGYYAIPGIPAGFYSLSAASEGYDTLTYTDVEIVEGNLRVQNFTLKPSAE